MERQRPRPKHRSLSNKRRSIVISNNNNNNNNNKEISRPKRSSFSSSKEPAIMTKDDLLNKLHKIKQHQTSRKSDFGKDLDEMKEFIINQKMNDEKYTNYNDKTSLKLIGIRDPKSLLYHREYMEYMNKLKNHHHDHHRTQSSVISSNIINHQHLRSYSSIMMPSKIDNNNNNETKEDRIKRIRNQSISYVLNIKNKKPSQIFVADHDNNKTFKTSQISTLQQLADEYESDSDDENQDDDIKGDQ